MRRSGFRFAATTLNGAAGRVMDFEFEQVAPYLLEFTNAALRMFAVATQTSGLTNGLPNNFRLVTTNDNQQVTGISTANPAVVTTNLAHGWTTGDQVVFLFDTSSAPGLLPLLTNRAFQITVTDATDFSIKDPLTGLTIDGSTLGWPGGGVTAGQLVVARTLKIVAPYLTADLNLIRKVQAETEAIFLHGSYQPQILNVVNLPTASAFATFSMQGISFTDGPYLDPPTDGSVITASSVVGTITLTVSTATSINGGQGFLASDVGRLMRLLSQPPAWNSATAYTAGQAVTYNGVYFSCIASSTGNEPDIATAFWSISTAVATWTWGKIVTYHSNLSVDLTVMGVNLLYSGATNPISSWRMGVYSTTTGWPTNGVYYEGRIWFAGSVANRIDGSVVNGISGSTINMTPTAVDGTVADNSAISYIFNSKDVNPIYWMIGTSAGILCGTLAREWLVQASQLSDPITPTSIQAHPISSYGCANIEPVHTELTICFVNRYQRKLHEDFSDVFSGKYNAPNLTRWAKHLTTTGIQEVRYQQELLPVVWMRCGDGSLVGTTYQRTTLFSSQGPEFNGWHRHALGSGRTVQSIATGPSVDGLLDTLAMATTDSSGVYHVELMQNMFDIKTPITGGWFLDDAVVPSSGVISTVAGVSTLTLYGLWHLNGKTVTVAIGGIDCGDYAVANGSVSVPIDSDPMAATIQVPVAGGGTVTAASFTSAYLAAISSTTAYGNMTCAIQNGGVVLSVPAQVGFTYTTQGQTLRPDAADQMRGQTGGGSLAKPRRVHQGGLLLNNTQGISVGTTFSALHKAILTSPGGTVNLTPLQLFSGIYWNPVDDNSSFDGMLAWQISRPYPAAVVSINSFVQHSDR